MGKVGETEKNGGKNLGEERIQKAAKISLKSEFSLFAGKRNA